MNSEPRRLPYFDILLEAFDRGDPLLSEAFAEHVHWGYWHDPALADGSVRDYRHAAEALSLLFAERAGVVDGLRVLDAGCGFGGTLACLNARHQNLDLVALNLEERQLERARLQVTPTV